MTDAERFSLVVAVMGAGERVRAADAAAARVRAHPDRLPNLVAVNFYERGDVLRAVDALNGVG